MCIRDRHKLFPDIKVSGEACPLWVSLVENNEYLVLYTKEYLKSHPNINYFIYGHRHICLLYTSPSSCCVR